MSLSTMNLQKPTTRKLAPASARFALKPHSSGSKRELRRIGGYLVVALFLLAAHLVFTRILQLQGLSYLLALAPLALILLNVIYFLRRMDARKSKLTLKINEGVVQLFQGPELIHSAFLSDLDVIRESSRIIRLRGPLFPGLTVGGPGEDATYRLHSEQKWLELTECLRK